MEQVISIQLINAFCSSSPVRCRCTVYTNYSNRQYEHFSIFVLYGQRLVSETLVHVVRNPSLQDAVKSRLYDDTVMPNVFKMMQTKLQVNLGKSQVSCLEYTFIFHLKWQQLPRLFEWFRRIIINHQFVHFWTKVYLRCLRIL